MSHAGKKTWVRNRWGLAVATAAALVLVGCGGFTSEMVFGSAGESRSVEASGPSSSQPDPDPSTTPVVATWEPAEAEAPDEPDLGPYTPRCETVSDELVDAAWAAWGDDATGGTQVLIGEGLTPGQLWWLVSYDDRVLVTDAPAGPEQPQWFVISPESDNPFYSIKWGPNRLERAKAALGAALACQSG